MDFDRAVEPDVIRECLEIALQAPTPGAMQSWRFVVVTDPVQRSALADLYRRAAEIDGQEGHLQASIDAARDESSRARAIQNAQNVRNFTANLARVPALVVPAVELDRRIEQLPPMPQVAQWGGIFPATWGFMLAARSRGLGTTITSIHLALEREAAEILDIPFDRVTQAGLVTVAYTVGREFKPALRAPLDSVVHWDRWGQLPGGLPTSD